MYFENFKMWKTKGGYRHSVRGMSSFTCWLPVPRRPSTLGVGVYFSKGLFEGSFKIRNRDLVITMIEIKRRLSLKKKEQKKQQKHLLMHSLCYKLARGRADHPPPWPSIFQFLPSNFMTLNILRHLSSSICVIFWTERYSSQLIATRSFLKIPTTILLLSEPTNFSHVLLNYYENYKKSAWFFFH